MIEGILVRLIASDEAALESVLEYRVRNSSFLAPYEPLHSREYYTYDFQQRQLEREKAENREGRSARFYIEPLDKPGYIIGTIGLSNIVRGAFLSCFLGYSLDAGYLNQGYMTEAVSLITEYAFTELKLHRIEANVMPRNKASLRVLEKNGYRSEGVSREYLCINGVWEDHVHMVRLNSLL